MADWTGALGDGIKGYCAKNPTSSKWSNFDGCYHVLLTDAVKLKATNPDLYDQRYGKLIMAATTPPPTTTDLNNSIQGLGAELLGLKEGLQSVATNVTNVANDVSKSSDTKPPGLSVDNKILIAAGAVLLFVFRKKIFH